MNRIKNILIVKDLGFPKAPDFSVKNSELIFYGVINHHTRCWIDYGKMW
jgi:cell shape-determining protein MreC